MRKNVYVKNLRKKDKELRKIMKVCKTCNKLYHIDIFKKSKDSKDGHINECKFCAYEKSKKFTYTCNHCKCEFKTHMKKQKYCSQTCASKQQFLKNSIVFNCDYCNKKHIVPISQYNRSELHFCSPKCNSKWQSENLRGENSHSFNKNLTKEEREKGRKYTEYYDWRDLVFKRDNYTCQCCNKKGSDINAHHLDGYHWCIEKRTSVENGVTLCLKCHKDFHIIYGHKNNSKEQFLEWINNRVKKSA